MQIHPIDHSDDGSVNWSIRVAHSGHSGEPFLNGENAIANPGIDGVERNQRIAHRFFVDRQRLDQQDLLTLVAAFLL